MGIVGGEIIIILKPTFSKWENNCFIEAETFSDRSETQTRCDNIAVLDTNQ